MGHYLKPNECNEIPTHIIAFDTEAFVESDVHKFRLGSAVYLHRRGNNWDKTVFTYKTLDEFYKFIDEHLFDRSITYLIAHNMKYDYRLTDMDEYLVSREFNIDELVISEQFIVSATRKNNQRISFIDTMNWFPHISLKILGHAFGLEKMEIPDNDFKTVTDDILIPYCINDSEIVALVTIGFINFIQEHNLGNFSLTIAGQAFNAFRHRFMGNKSVLVHGNQEIYTLETDSYRGGRSDIFKQGTFLNIIKLDINSMYPYVMRENKYPSIVLSQGIIKNHSRELNDLINDTYNDNRFLLARCDIEINEPSIAIKREKLIFPVGKIKNVPLTSPEIKYISEHGKIHNISEYVLYENNNIFSDYVDYFYKLKSESVDPIREMTKRFLNALYGRFAMKEFGGIEIVDEINDKEIKYILDAIDGNVYYDHTRDRKIMRIGNKIYAVKAKSDRPAKQSSPIISSAVTSYARMYLWNLIKICGLENVYYCDTDSIFTNKKGYERLDSTGFVDSKKLGKLKVEGIGDCILRGPKDYEWFDASEDKKYNRCIKGVPAKATQNDNGKFKYEQWVTGLNAYKNKKHGEIEIKQIEKTMSREYDKGIIDKNGIVHPFILEEF